MSAQKNREIRLKRRPQGLPSPDDFELAETTVPSPTTGQVQVRNIYMSVDPYMRGRMVERESYVQPFEIGKPLSSGAVGQVVATENPNFRPGDYVSNFSGWQEWFVTGGKNATSSPSFTGASSLTWRMLTAARGRSGNRAAPGKSAIVSASTSSRNAKV